MVMSYMKHKYRLILAKIQNLEMLQYWYVDS